MAYVNLFLAILLYRQVTRYDRENYFELRCRKFAESSDWSGYSSSDVQNAKLRGETEEARKSAG